MKPIRYLITMCCVAIAACGGNGGSSAPPTYDVAGTLTLAGVGVAGAAMTLTGGATSITDTNGNYRLPGVANGNYTLTPTKAGLVFSPSSMAVSVNGANVVGADFRAISAANTYTITGTVSGATTSVNLALSGTSTGNVATGPGGTYTFPGLVNGNYTVTPSRTGYAFNPVSAMVTISGASTAETNFAASNDRASLPENLLTQPASSNCAALRSGRYNQILLVADSLNLPGKIAKVSVDAVAATWNGGSGSVNLVAAGESCHYTLDTATEFVVSPAGVVVMRLGPTATKYLGIALPEQKFTLADMAGTWNTLAMDSTGAGTYKGVASTTTLNSAGAVTARTLCSNATSWNVTSCTSDSSAGQPSLRVNSDGGFDTVDASNAVVGRIFAYKAGNGDIMGVNVNADGSFQLLTKQRANSLPIVGAVTSNWDLELDNLLTSPVAISAHINAIIATISTEPTDPINQSWLRSQKTVGATDAHLEILYANKPRNGYTLRPLGAAMAADGSRVTFAEFTGLGLCGMGMSALLYPAQERFSFSVDQP